MNFNFHSIRRCGMNFRRAVLFTSIAPLPSLHGFAADPVLSSGASTGKAEGDSAKNTYVALASLIGGDVAVHCTTLIGAAELLPPSVGIFSISDSRKQETE